MDHQQSWEDVLDRFRGLGSNNDFGRQMVSLLLSLRDRWEPVVQVDTWMFDLVFSARGQPKSTTVRLERSPPGQAESEVVISLQEDHPRTDLEHMGGRMTVAGDHCRPENAETVLESFLLQLATHPDR